MTPRILLTALLMLSMASPCFSQTKVPKGLKKKFGVEDISVDNKMPASTLTKIYSRIRRQDYEEVLNKMSEHNINVKKLIFSDKFSVEIRFSYSSMLPDFETDVHIAVDKKTNGMSRDDVISFVDYIQEIKDILMASDLQHLYDIFDDYANGDNICMDASEEGTKNEYKALLVIKDVEIEKLKEGQRIASNKGLIYQIKNYLIFTDLNKDKDVKASLEKVLSDGELDDAKKISAVKKSLISKDMYDGQIKKVLDDDLIDNKREVERLQDLIKKDPHEYYGISIPDDVDAALGYYDLKALLSCNIEDFFFLDAIFDKAE
jgi:hypothetical protein